MIGESRKFIKTKKAHKRFRASRLFEYIHIDITNVTTLQEGVCKVAFVKDNFSKACLYSEVLMDGSSFAITNLLKSALEKYALYSQSEPVNIVCDGGPENKGDLDLWISSLKQPSTIKLTAQTETFPFSNNMSESIHHIFKNIFLRDYIVYDRASLILKLKEFELFYGHILYPLELYGFTSQQVLNGAIPDKHRFALQIENSQKMRAKENHATVYCKECFPQA